MFKLNTKFKKVTALLIMVCLMFITFGCIGDQAYMPSSDDAEVKYPEVTGDKYSPENPYQMDTPSDEYGRFKDSTRGAVTFENSNSFDTSMNNDNFRVAVGYTPEGSDVTVNMDIGPVSKTVTLSDPDAFYNDYQNVVVDTGYSLDYLDEDGDGKVEVTIEHSSSEKGVKIHEVAYVADQTSSTSTDDGGTSDGGTTEGSTGDTDSSTGTVEFYTDPIGANVYVDGENKGQTSSYSYGVLTFDLSEGSHSYKVSASDYETEEGTFSVTGGETNTVSVSLDESTSDDDGGDDGGDEDSNTPPSAKISASQTSETMIVFNSDSSDPDGEVAKEEWFLNGESVSTGSEYQLDTNSLNSGTYVVELDVTDDQGATSTAKYQVTIDKEKKIVEEEESPGNGTGDNQTEGDSRPVLQVPGFEALFAIAGLVIVVLLARRGEDR